MFQNQNQKSHPPKNHQMNPQKKSLKKNNQKMTKAISMIYKAKEPKEKNKGKEINCQDCVYHKKKMINCKINKLRYFVR